MGKRHDLLGWNMRCERLAVRLEAGVSKDTACVRNTIERIADTLHERLLTLVRKIKNRPEIPPSVISEGEMAAAGMECVLTMSMTDADPAELDAVVSCATNQTKRFVTDLHAVADPRMRLFLSARIGIHALLPILVIDEDDCNENPNGIGNCAVFEGMEEEGGYAEA